MELRNQVNRLTISMDSDTRLNAYACIYDYEELNMIVR